MTAVSRRDGAALPTGVQAELCVAGSHQRQGCLVLLGLQSFTQEAEGAGRGVTPAVAG